MQCVYRVFGNMWTNCGCVLPLAGSDREELHGIFTQQNKQESFSSRSEMKWIVQLE